MAKKRRTSLMDVPLFLSFFSFFLSIIEVQEIVAMVMVVAIMMHFQSLVFWLFYLLLLICSWQKKEEGREIHKQSNQRGSIIYHSLGEGFMYNILQFGLRGHSTTK